MTKDRKLIGIGGAGALLAMLCCFTPLLVFSLGALGLSTLIGWWLDPILFLALFCFLLLLGYGFYMRQRRTAAADDAP